jgi:hypothetical protein
MRLSLVGWAQKQAACGGCMQGKGPDRCALSAPKESMQRQQQPLIRTHMQHVIGPAAQHGMVLKGEG